MVNTLSSWYGAEVGLNRKFIKLPHRDNVAFVKTNCQNNLLVKNGSLHYYYSIVKKNQYLFIEFIEHVLLYGQNLSLSKPKYVLIFEPF